MIAPTASMNPTVVTTGPEFGLDCQSASDRDPRSAPAKVWNGLRGREVAQPRRTGVLESLQAMSLITIMETVDLVILLAGSDLRDSPMVAQKAGTDAARPGSNHASAPS